MNLNNSIKILIFLHVTKSLYIIEDTKLSSDSFISVLRFLQQQSISGATDCRSVTSMSEESGDSIAVKYAYELSPPFTCG